MYWQIPSPFSPTLTSHFLLISLIYHHHHHIGSYNCLGINFVRLTIYVVSGEGINFDKVSICYVFCCLLDDPWWYVEEKNPETMKGFLQYLFCLCVCGLHGTSFDLGTEICIFTLFIGIFHFFSLYNSNMFLFSSYQSQFFT